MGYRITSGFIAAGGFFLFSGCSGSGGSGPSLVSGKYHFTDAGFTEPPGGEEYRCWFVDVPVGGPTDYSVGVTRFSYSETAHILHHVVVFTSTDTNDPSGSNRPCTLFETGFWSVAYAGGKDTGPLVFPAVPSQVALPMRKTQRFVFELHLLNASTNPVVDDTQVEIDFTSPGQSFTPASLIFSGNQSFTVPATGSAYNITGTCTVPFSAGASVFAVWPHMHRLGTHFKITHTTSAGGSSQSILDWPWYFDPQPMMVLTNGYLQVAGGDVLNTTCTYDNTTGQPVSFGEYSNQEMCFDFFYYFPALGDSSIACLQ